ncbi:MAG: BMC domain-containing protein [Spirochaetia bacterium]|jgi:microcompartment protein CcmL/EutN|nr:BMC domain-containing protein [Spirochaetia bacterium]
MNIDVIGILELSSMADGLNTLDAVVKESPVTILKAEPVNPGKFLIMITGDVASVEAAMISGLEIAGNSIVDHILLKNLDDQVIPAIKNCRDPEEWDAIGLLETNSVAAAVEAADMAVKEAEIHIIGIVTGNETGGKALVKISGSIGDLNSAMSSAVIMLRNKNQLYKDIIIPGPHIDIKGFVCGN